MVLIIFQIPLKHRFSVRHNLYFVTGPLIKTWYLVTSFIDSIFISVKFKISERYKSSIVITLSSLSGILHWKSSIMESSTAESFIERVWLWNPPPAWHLICEIPRESLKTKDSITHPIPPFHYFTCCSNRRFPLLSIVFASIVSLGNLS